MKAGEVMTVGVATVRPDASITDAARMMLDYGVSGLPVVDGSNRLVGIVTEGDFLRRAETGTERHRSRWLEFLVGPGRLEHEYVHSHGRRVEQIMTPGVITVAPSTSLQEIVSLMERHRIKRVPVVSGNRIVGIISRANLVQGLARLAEDAAPSHPDDEAMRMKILDEINRQTWAPSSTVNVIVRNGVAELWGIVLDKWQREAVRVAAENVPGITAVKDHLVFMEPTSDIAIESPDDAADSRRDS